LVDTKAIGIDMETATIFTTGFANKIPRGALMLVSDNPLVPEGVKTSANDKQVTAKFVNLQFQQVGILRLLLIILLIIVVLMLRKVSSLK
jgi:AMP nucleosidase